MWTCWQQSVYGIPEYSILRVGFPKKALRPSNRSESELPEDPEILSPKRPQDFQRPRQSACRNIIATASHDLSYLKGAELQKRPPKRPARGIYTLAINGTGIIGRLFLRGRHELQPHTSLPYVRHHRTHQPKAGTLWRFALAEGWWSGGATFVGENWNFYGDRRSSSPYRHRIYRRLTYGNTYRPGHVGSRHDGLAGGSSRGLPMRRGRCRKAAEMAACHPDSRRRRRVPP